MIWAARRIDKIAFTLVMLSAALISPLGQQSIPTPKYGGPHSLSELLRQHNVELTEPSLLAALKNPDPQVRYLAAAKLAADRDVDAVPSIEQALIAEAIPQARVNIAYALAQLGDDKGIAALEQTCNDSEAPGYLKARAITYLLAMDQEACLRTVLDMLKPSADSDSRIQALSLVPSFQHISTEESRSLFDFVVAALGDKAAAVRIAATTTLGALKNSDAIPYLEKAAANEPDEAVRSQMRNTIQTLTGAKHAT